MTLWMLDTNIPLRGLLPGQPNHDLARSAGRMLIERGDELCFTLQLMTEFWNVCTRPAALRGGLGLSSAQANRRMQIVERTGIFLADTDEVREHWRRLVVTYQVQGVQVHDTRLVASMMAHNVTHLLTFNVADFRRFGEIVAAHPQDIVDGRF